MRIPAFERVSVRTVNAQSACVCMTDSAWHFLRPFNDSCLTRLTAQTFRASTVNPAASWAYVQTDFILKVAPTHVRYLIRSCSLSVMFDNAFCAALLVRVRCCLCCVLDRRGKANDFGSAIESLERYK